MEGGGGTSFAEPFFALSLEFKWKTKTTHTWEKSFNVSREPFPTHFLFSFIRARELGARDPWRGVPTHRG